MKSFLQGIGALAVLAGLCVGLALGVRWFVGWVFDGVDPTVSAAMVAAMATTLVSVLGVTLGRYMERRRQIEVEIRERKIPMYTTMVEGLIGGLIAGVETGDTAELEQLFTSLTPQLVTWASDNVIKEWNAFKRQSSAAGDPTQIMFNFEKVLTAVRADLGHRAGDLAQGDLLGLFVNDIHEHVPAGRK